MQGPQPFGAHVSLQYYTYNTRDLNSKLSLVGRGTYTHKEQGGVMSRVVLEGISMPCRGDECFNLVRLGGEIEHG